ncbi:MAG: hypothetical protein AAF581_10310 [Planctomycetota bacterium]
MRHTKRDLRAADMLALILVGLGLIMVARGAWFLFADEGAGPKGGSRVALVGVVLLALGGAVNLKVRELARNGGSEVPDNGSSTE